MADTGSSSSISTISSCCSTPVPSRLLQLIKETDSVTPVLEEKITASFLKKLRGCVDQNFSISTVHILEEYLACVLTVSEIDDKYVKYFYIDDEICHLLIAVLRKETLRSDNNFWTLMYNILILVHDIVKYCPSQRNVFIQKGLHNFLLMKSKVEFDSSWLMLSLDIFLFLSESKSQNISEQVLSAELLDWVCYVLQCWIEKNAYVTKPLGMHADDQLILTSLCLARKIARLVRNRPLEFKIRQFHHVFTNLAKTFPQHKEEIDEVFSLLTDSTTSEQVKLCLSELKVNVNRRTLDNAAIVSRQISDQLSYFRGEYIDKVDPDTNVFLAQQKIEDILRDSTAQLICGMLNSNKGGVIYMGISSDRRINGITVSFDQRDCFRQGLDKLFHDQISPALHPSLFDVRFIPVKGKETNQFDSLYVICLIIPDNINTVYSAKPQNEQHKFCYIYNARTGNVALNFNQVRHLAISFTEKRFPPLNS